MQTWRMAGGCNPKIQENVQAMPADVIIQIICRLVSGLLFIGPSVYAG